MRLAVTGVPDNTPLVTASRALADVAYQQFTRAHLKAGAESWQRPEIYTLEAWLTSIWQEARYSTTELPALLSPAQEHFLWQQIIAAERPDFFDTGALARLAAQAANTIAEYSIPITHEAWSEQQHAEQFRSWFASFRQRCEREGWMARREILQRLKPCSQPAFIGFDKAPAPGRVLALTGTGRVARVPLKQVDTFRAEAELAARWARAQFEGSPGKSIAVFVPRLRTQATLVERIFRSIFYPGRAVQLDSDPPESVFHLNAPKPLSDVPLIASALLLLDLAKPRIPQANATAILRNPFLTGAAQERAARAKADLQLRRTRELEVTLPELEKAARDCVRLQPVWARVHAVLDRSRQSNTFPRWARFFADLLHAAGWPGDLELSAPEQRIVEMWKDALSTLSALGMVSGPVSLDIAVGQLKRLLAIGGPETGDWLSPVQILDATDAVGLSFDAAFLTGLGDETWPQTDPISPLIPARLQKAFGVPGADAAGVRKTGIEATRALLHAAPHIAGSYHERLAPQVRTVAGRVIRLDSETWQGKSPLESFAPSDLDEYRETHGPRFDTSQEAKGGTRLIKAQSDCPFKAFASSRLKAALPEDASFGFDSLDRGLFVHAALENVWSELKTSQALHAATPEGLDDLVGRAVDKALTSQDTTEFYSQATDVERERLHRLITDWLLTVEKARTLPFTVASAEEPMHITLGGLPLSVRMDRVDRLPNGGLVLIDYKTGADINRNRLVGDRPREPQLLIYAAAQQVDVEGLLFGCLEPRDLRLAGVTRRELIKSKRIQVQDDWPEFLQLARETVEKLAREYVAGEAVIMPSKEACGFCDLPALCRKQEQQSMAEEE